MTPIIKGASRVFATGKFGNALKPQARTAGGLAAASAKRAGDISDAFVSLSGQDFKPLEPRYADIKAELIRGREKEVEASFHRLLNDLKKEIPLIAREGSKIIPEIQLEDVDNASDHFRSELKKRGVAVVRGVVPEKEALQLKEELKEYIRNNPQTKAFPADNPQVFELYWSPSQIKARGHPNLLRTQQFLMEFWYSKDPNAPISPSHPISYADRLRMRLPGDAKFALGPHVDGGSVERWDPAGYGRGHVYTSIFSGSWESYTAWEPSSRLYAVSDLHQGVGACSMFRMFQGWLSLSHTGPGEGTLLVNPLLEKATAYYLLRPFFSPVRGWTEGMGKRERDVFLAPENWRIDETQTSWLQGATPGHGQELHETLHPHLDLAKSMVHVPNVGPGDYVVWHADTIHAVDKIHNGMSDSSVMYIPVCPLTEDNARFLVRQREAFVQGAPSPDFGGGVGEAEHVGRVRVEDAVDKMRLTPAAKRAFGLEKWDSDDTADLQSSQREVLDRANKILGFYG
ncbi:DUF1479-domain-containing protein [Patellaria atrata CBS 101060]|uniref:DUF1479-domain-containing protein n=1 Tax=Patellaria atrata CBS 101060 TaxID=1346257 RepID=A0A9P4VN13_9PEZI|nr:DUF1479-domain-containing protein [Patellaria atrata CBS 101060]